MRVLVIRFSSLGDVVLATAAVQALGEDVPAAKLDILTKPAFREVFRGLPAVSRVLDWEPREGLRALGRQVRAGGYDWVADLHGSLRSHLLRLLVPGPRWARVRKGVLRRRAAVLLRRPSLLDASHVVDRYIRALAPLGVSPVRRLPRIALDEEEIAGARRALRREGWDGKMQPVALAPGARWPTKAWPAEAWSQLLARLARDGAVHPVLLGGRDERELSEGIARRAGVAVADVVGRTTARETAAVLSLCGAAVSNDSAPLHLSTAVGTPVVALFGPTVRGFGFYPLGARDRVLEEELRCRPCSLHGDPECPRSHHRCLRVHA